MVRLARSEVFDPDEIVIAHVYNRTVGRCFLMGDDPVSGKNFDHRKVWIEQYLKQFAAQFGIDLLGIGILSNHIHQILRNRPDVVAQWSDEEVAIRWLRVFPGRRLEEYLAEPTENDVKTLARDKERLAEVRRRLSDISWFMRALAEPIARMANKQDECTGRFWEGRFKAQQIVDEAGLLACSMYVDLNPVRAAMAKSPEKSVHTSAYDRIEGSKGEKIASAAFDLKPVPTQEAAKKIREPPVDELRQERKTKRRNPTGKRIRRDGWLSPLRLKPEVLSNQPEVHTAGLRSSDKGFLSLNLSQYKRLLDWTAQRTRSGATAVKEIPPAIARTLGELGIDASMWRDLVWEWQKYFGKSVCIGRPESIREHAEQTGRHHYRGQASCKACFA